MYKTSQRLAKTLRWEWNECDGPPVEMPTREGFGSRLLKRVLTQQIGAQVTVEFPREGLHVLVNVPISSPAAPAGAVGPVRAK